MNNVIFFTGAGISADSGVPTFSELPDIRQKLTRTYANENPEGYRDVIREFVKTCEQAVPNPAHLAIAKAGFPVITMNIDGLHEKAGSENVLNLHGTLPTREELEEEFYPIREGGIVLYGDIAPNYEIAMKMVKKLPYGQGFFIVIGTSFYTTISTTLLELAKKRHAHILIINEQASKRVPEVCDRLSNKKTEE